MIKSGTFISSKEDRRRNRHGGILQTIPCKYDHTTYYHTTNQIITLKYLQTDKLEQQDAGLTKNIKKRVEFMLHNYRVSQKKSGISVQGSF